MIRIGVVGYGYWGPNIVRNFSRLTQSSVAWVCDMNPVVLREIPLMYPTIRVTNNVDDLLSDPSLDAVVIVTPTSTHYMLAKKALTAGKHVLVEKPLTPNSRQARILVSLAGRKKRILMVDYTYVYTPAIRKLKSIISNGELGDIVYIDSVRTNLGILQKDTNVIYDLAAHDFSIMDYLFGSTPKTITATGVTHKALQQETTAYIGASYANGMFAHFHVSWLSPVKIRRMILVGTKKMLTYDDIEPSEKIKVYDKGVSFVKDPGESYQLRIGYRSGNAVVPHIPLEEGLFGMAKEFVTAIREKRRSISDGSMGLRVVSCLEAATASLRKNGKPVRV